MRFNCSSSVWGIEAVCGTGGVCHPANGSCVCGPGYTHDFMFMRTTDCLLPEVFPTVSSAIFIPMYLGLAMACLWGGRAAWHDKVSRIVTVFSAAAFATFAALWLAFELNGRVFGVACIFLYWMCINLFCVSVVSMIYAAVLPLLSYIPSYNVRRLQLSSGRAHRLRIPHQCGSRGRSGVGRRAQ